MLQPPPYKGHPMDPNDNVMDLCNIATSYTSGYVLQPKNAGPGATKEVSATSDHPARNCTDLHVHVQE